MIYDRVHGDDSTSAHRLPFYGSAIPAAPAMDENARKINPATTYVALLIVQACHLLHHHLAKRHISFAEVVSAGVLCVSPAAVALPGALFMTVHLSLIAVQIVGSLWIRRLSPSRSAAVSGRRGIAKSTFAGVAPRADAFPRHAPDRAGADTGRPPPRSKDHFAVALAIFEAAETFPAASYAFT